MKITPKELRVRENAIFDALERRPGDATFRNRLYRDGVPTPESYLAQRVRVLFVFREPNFRGAPHPHDMRDEVSDERFRPLRNGTRRDVSTKAWWNGKAGMFAHAVAAVLDGEPARKAFERFSQSAWNHAVVNRFAYVQIKKVGGRGTSKAGEIRAHAAKYADVLKQQLELYRPDLVIGCGVGKDSPTRLLARYVLIAGEERRTSKTGAKWWKFPAATHPQALVQLWHPAWRGERWTLYKDVWESVHEVAKNMRLGVSS